MRSLLRKVAVAGISTALLGGVAFASVSHRDNDEGSFTDTSETAIMTHNDTDLFNMIAGNLDTGDNHADKNHQDGKVTTGGASGTVNLTTTANKATVKVTSPDSCFDCDTDAEKVMIKREVNVCTSNDVDLKNIVKVEAETGDNTAYHNGRDGVVTTGAASLNISVTNTLNTSDTTVN